MEIIIKKQPIDLQKIDFNFEELKSEIKLSLEKYDNLLYTDSQISEAKADRASLNKFFDALDNKRKEIKNACLKPYVDFEAKVKELQELIKAPVTRITMQINDYDERRKLVKKNEIENFYQSIDISNIINLEKIFDSKWLNATAKMSAIQAEITKITDNIREDLKVLQSTDSEFSAQMKDKYLQTLNLAAAIAEKDRLQLQNSKIQNFENQSSEEKQQKTESETAQIQNLQQIDFRVWVTAEQKQTIKNFLIANNIKYGKVK